MLTCSSCKSSQVVVSVGEKNWFHPPPISLRLRKNRRPDAPQAPLQGLIASLHLT